MNRIHNTGGIPFDPGIGQQRSVAQRDSASFSDILQHLRQKQGVQFSAHAQHRLNERGIQLSDDTLNKLNQAVEKAANKGARDALVLMPGAVEGDDLAFVVSVANRTVITAVNGDHLEDNVFTNIDSAVIAK